MRQTKKAAALAMGAGLIAATPAHPETQTEYIVAEQRVSVGVAAKTEAVQAFLPPGWTVAAAPGAANLTLIFMDRTLQLTPDGKPLGAGMNRNLVLAVGARNQAGETRTLIVGGYSADPAYVPGAYKVNQPGTVTVARSETKTTGKDGKLVTQVAEQWQARGADGATVDLELAYTRDVPRHAVFEQKVWSGADPEFWRIYRGEQATETLLSASVNRVAVKLKARGGKLGAAVDGTEKVASVVSTPFYSRRTFVK